MSEPKNPTDGVWRILPTHDGLDFRAFTPTTTPPTLEELQAFVGGYVEHVELRNVGHGWLDEDGKMKGLPINQVATNLCHLSHAIARDDFIVGPFMLTVGKASPE
jgi:hypothetical protein